MVAERLNSYRLLILFPGALGDFLCALPSFLGLRAANGGEAFLVANPSLLDLVEPRQFRPVSVHRREVADLFGAQEPLDATYSLFGGFDLVHSWTGYGDPEFAERLRLITGGRVHVHRFRGMRPHEHAVDYYARCAAVCPLPSPPWSTVGDQVWADEWCRCHVGEGRHLLIVHPGSGSNRKNWEGFSQLIREIRPYWRGRAGRLLVLLGPAEADRDSTAWDGTPLLRNVGLRKVAALLRRTTLYLGNDSGISHLAAALQTPSIVLFGSSDPDTWGPRASTTQVLAAPRPCVPCGPDRFCTHRLPVANVFAAIKGAQSLPGAGIHE